MLWIRFRIFLASWCRIDTFDMEPDPDPDMELDPEPPPKMSILTQIYTFFLNFPKIIVPATTGTSRALSQEQLKAFTTDHC